MLKQIREAREKESGFTLIELLIVIIVLGILAAIVLFALGTFKGDSAKSACKADIKQIRTAETAYYAKHNSYTASLTDLKNAGYIQDVPNTDNYTITVNGSTGAVTGTLDTAVDNSTNCEA
jgi:general secretion pathway protein G